MTLEKIEERYIELDTEEYGTYVFKGHNLDKTKLLQFIKKNYNEAKIYELEETGGHWGFSSDCEYDRYLYFDTKYLKSKGGFPITLVRCS